jgi:hypothetical protein
MHLKNQSYNDRVKKGNKIGDLNNLYLSQRFNLKIESITGNTDDTRNGIDSICKSLNKTFQCKARKSKYGDDVLQEAQLIIPKPLGHGIPSPPYNIKEGRDMHGMSDYTTCMPVAADMIIIVATKILHKAVYGCMKEWADIDGYEIKPYISRNESKCNIIDISEKQLFKWSKKAYESRIHAILMFTSKKFVNSLGKSAQIWYNVDSSSGNYYQSHGKFIVYLPLELFKKRLCIKFNKGEIWNQPNTWLGYKNENFQTMLKKL